MVDSVKGFVAKCKERNQLAKVVIVPKAESEKNGASHPPEDADSFERTRASQLSLEAAEKFLTDVEEQKTSRIKP